MDSEDDSEEEVSGMIRPTLINDLRAILEEYPDNGQIFKELIQNAEDAEATTLRIIYDAVGSEVNPNIPPHFQGPAIYVYNDATFTEKDWEGIKMLRKSVKEEDPMKVGRYGLGFKSVFHITDFPCIVSEDTLLLLDPGQPEDRVCTSHRISKGKTTVRCMEQIFSRVCDMSSLRNRQGFLGTLFRFPLRKTSSELSTVIYDHDKVTNLLKCFRTEMTLVLIFLKSLDRVEIWTSRKQSIQSSKEQAGGSKRSGQQHISPPQISFSVALTETSASERKKAKQDLSSRMRGKSTFQLTSNVSCDVRDHFTGLEFSVTWMVKSYCLGEEEMSPTLRKLCKDPNLSYLPFVGVSILDTDTTTEETMQEMGLMTNTLNGHVFCFLPLPLENHSLTGLPVHVNGFFALSSNRHHLKWPTADEGQVDSTDTSCLWNQNLLKEAIPKVYRLLLEELIASSKKQGNTQESVTRVYSAFPSAESVTSMWKCVLNELYETILQTPCFFTKGNGGSWVTLYKAAFCLSSSEDVPFEVLEILVNLGQTVCPVPQHVFSAVKLFAGGSMKKVTPKFVRDVLKKNFMYAYTKEDQFNTLQLLDYILEDLDGGHNVDLLGIGLLPLANGTFTSFISRDGGSPIFYPTRTFDRALFPGLEDQFIADSSTHDFPADLERKLKKLCLSEMTQVRYVRKDDFPDLVKRVVSNIYRPSGDIWEWITKLWSVLYAEFSSNLPKFQGLRILPTSLHPKVMADLEALQSPSPVVLKQWKGTTLNDEIEAVITQLGVRVVKHIPQEVLRHPGIMGVFVNEPLSSSVLQALTATKRDAHSSRVLRMTERQRLAFVSFVSSCERAFTAEECRLLAALQLFTALCPDGKVCCVSALDVNTSAPPEIIPIFFPRKLIKYGTLEEKLFGTKLGVRDLGVQDLVVEILQTILKFPDIYNSLEIRRFLDYILTNQPYLNADAWDLMPQIPFLPFSDQGMILRKPSDLFDPSVAGLKDLFAGVNVFPVQEFVKHVSVLTKLGLKTTVQDEDVLTCAETLENMQTSGKRTVLIKKANALITVIANHPHLPGNIVQELKHKKFIPVKTKKPNNVPHNFPWYHGHGMFCSPSEVVDERFENVIGSVLPITKFPSELGKQERQQLVATFEMDSPPPLPKLVEQLRIILDSFDINSMDGYLAFVKGVYKELNKLDVRKVLSEMRDQDVIDSKWIWNGKEFSRPNDVYVVADTQDLNLEPYMTCLPKDMHSLKSFFLSFGCHRNQDQEMMLHVLHLIKAKKSATESVGIGDFHYDLEIVLRILRWLAKNKQNDDLDPSKLLLPVHLDDDDEDFGMMPADQCAYCDSSEWITADDISEGEAINFVHKDVPRDLALSLGVSPLMDKLLDATELDLSYEQTEPLTRRLKNLIQHYTDGVAVVKELVQNADDVGADEVCFLYDERENENSRNCLLNKNMAECQGPALWTYNNAEFSKEDFENITKISGATKLNDAAKIGKFGLGFNAVYNLTDVPSFVSGDFFVIFDPHTRYLGKPGIKINTDKNKKMVHRLKEQFNPFNGVFGCNLASEDSKYFHGTLFRFPLRTQQQADCSQISSLHYSREEMIKLLQKSLDCAGNLLLFTQNVKLLKFFHQSRSASQRTLLFEVSTVSHSNDLPNKPHLNLQHTVTLNKNRKSCEKLQIKPGQRQEKVKWLTCSSLGSQITQNFLKRNPDMKGLHSEGSVAIPLKSTGNPPCGVMAFQDCPTGFFKHGVIYCYLPLPIPTSLPVLINGSFSVTSDRRHLSQTTVDEKENRGSKWNEVLISDSVAQAYVQMLVSLTKLGYSGMFELWPNATNCETVLKPLLYGFYNTLGSDFPEIFAGRSKWTSLKNASFLDPSFRFESGKTGQVAFDVFHQLLELQTTDKVAVDLPQYIRTALSEFEQKDFVRKNTVSMHEFYTDMFLPNIRKVNHSRRDTLILYALENGDSILLEALEGSCCIPVDESGTELCKPADLVHPWGRIACLYDHSEKRFPAESFHSEQILHTLKNLGMLKDTLPPVELLGRATAIAVISKSKPEEATIKFKTLLEYLSRTSTKNITDDVKEKISSIKFLPVLQRPDKWPAQLRWKADGVATFSSPESVFHCKLKYLIGSQAFLLASEDIKHSSRDVLKQLGVRLEPDPRNVVYHMRLLSKVDITRLNRQEAKYLQSIYEKAYDFWEKQCRHFPTAADMEDKPPWMEDLVEIKSLYLDKDHVDPQKVAFEFQYDCSPYLFVLSKWYAQKYPMTMRLLGVKMRFGSSDVLQGLGEFYEKHNHRTMRLDEIRLLNRLTTALVETLKSQSSSMEDIEVATIMLPDKNHWLCPTGMLCFDDCPWIQTAGDTMRYVHNSVSRETAETLGVRGKQQWCVSAYSDGIQIPFGQTEELTARLKGILHGYPCDSTILKELLQNADDSGATEIKFIKDMRTHKSEKVFSDGWKELQGPALCVYNNAAFSEEDFLGIQSLGEGSKRENPLKTGKYGVGFNVVYHLTDVPSFFIKSRAGDTLCAFDPNRNYIPNMTPMLSGMRWHQLNVVRKQFPDSFSCYMEEVLRRSTEGTLFRFPLRNDQMARKSKIKSEPMTPANLNRLLKQFEQEAKEALLFTKSVNRIQIIDVQRNGRLVVVCDIKVNTDEISSAQRQQFHSKCREMLGELQNGAPVESVDVTEVKYFVEIQDIRHQTSDRWFIKQGIGFRNQKPVPDPKGANSARTVSHLPTGGIAFPLTYLPDRKYKAFRCLPLPIPTGLPVHIEADFALDYEQRRSLYYSPNQDLDTKWNETIVEQLLAPLYSSGLQDLAKEYVSLKADRENKDRIELYHALFPETKLAETHYWKLLCTACYQCMDRMSSPVLPVVNKIHSEREKMELTVIKKWLPPTGEGNQQCFFNTLEKQNIERTPKLYGYEMTRDEKQPSKASNLTSLLLRLNFNLVVTPLNIFNNFQEANVDVKDVSPNATISFLRSFSDEASLCRIGNLPCPLQQTNIKSKGNFLDLLSYCCMSENLNQSLEGLPLSLTCDGILRVFKEAEKVFISVHHDIVPKSAACFLDTKVKTSLGLDEDQITDVPEVKPFTIMDFCRLLPLELDESVYSNNQPVPWNADGTVTNGWLQKVWSYLGASVVMQSPGQRSTVTRVSMLPALKPIETWSLIPVTSFKDGENELYLVPISFARQVFTCTGRSIEENLKKIGLYFLKDKDGVSLGFSMKWDTSLPSSLLVCCSEAPEVLCAIFSALSSPLKSVIHNQLTLELCTGILQYFSDSQNLDVIMGNPQHKELLTQLPFYVTVYNKGVRIIQGKTFVLPRSIPTDGMEKWSQKESLVLLKDDWCLITLHRHLGLRKCTEIDFYCNYIFKSFQILDKAARAVHLEFVRDELIPKTGESEMKVLEEGLKKLAFIPHENTLKKASSFCDHNRKFFNLMLDDNHFVPKAFRDEKWHTMLVKAGLTRKVSTDMFVGLTQELETEAGEMDHDNVILEKSEALVQNLYGEQKAAINLLRRIKDIKFLVPLPPNGQLTKFAANHKDGTSLICFKGSVLPEYQQLIWSSASILRQYCIPTHDTGKILKELGVRLSPSCETVVQNMQNILHVVNKGNQLQRGEMENQSDALFNIFCSMYKFLQASDELSDDLRRILCNSQCVMVPEHRHFVKPTQVVIELKTDKQIKPYLFSLPTELGSYQKLMLSLGVCKAVSVKHYVKVLTDIRAACKEEELEPNETDAALTAMKGLHKALGKSEGKAEIDELFLPGRIGETNVIRAAQTMVVSDNTILEERATELNLVFLLESKDRKIDAVKLRRIIPNDHKPRLLSELVEEKLTDLCRSDCVQSGSCLRIQEAVSSTDTIQGCICLIEHYGFGDDVVDTQLCIEHLQALLSSVKVFCCSNITTCLVYEGKQIPGSEGKSLLQHHENIQSEDISAIHIFLQEGTLEDAAKCFKQIMLCICNKLRNLPNEVILHFPDLFLVAYRGESVSEYLNEQRIQPCSMAKETKKRPVSPTPGSYIPVRLHWLLDPSFTFFERGQYVGYEVDDPMLAGEDGDAVYVYAVIVEVVHESASTSWQKRYKIDIGEIITVPATDLYAFHRKSQSPIMELEIYTGSTESTQKDQENKPLKEVKKEIFRMLTEAWQVDEQQRRKVIKRLLLKWHPDKNVGREDFCTKITQYIFMLIGRFEKGNFDPFYDDNEPSRDTTKRRPTSGFYGHFFSRARKRGQEYHSSYRDFESSDDTDGGHYSGFRDNWTHGSNPQPSEGRRWFRQAQADFRVITNDVDGPNPSSSWVCFKSQQVAEKALKAVLYARNANDGAIRSHDLETIAKCLGDNTLLRLARELESILGSKGYLRTRYPDMLHGHQIPAEVYTRDQAVRSKDVCGRILDITKSLLDAHT